MTSADRSQVRLIPATLSKNKIANSLFFRERRPRNFAGLGCSIAFEFEATILSSALAGPAGYPHADPFDRLLIAQARDERLTLLTRDAAMLGLRLDCIDSG